MKIWYCELYLKIYYICHLFIVLFYINSAKNYIFWKYYEYILLIISSFLLNYQFAQYIYINQYFIFRIFSIKFVLFMINFYKAVALIYEKCSAKRLFLFTQKFPRSGFLIHAKISTKWVSYSRRIFHEVCFLFTKNFPRSGFLIHEEFSTKWVSYSRRIFHEVGFLFTKNFPRSGFLIHRNFY